ncbi:uncharacterized protein LOC106154878 isoform X2 [Lingula anatina]|uniref:Uncharacterized protein LOC106154878 isoform X1 n=1 Tax=Lingula anatina TaxID=7574 RepID=A0A1S3HFL4_LINAN|nr:uncharacterized protein LOC106154878 isoform X1 [Lingula anatina]XP_013384869.1 uncharacterized protein LOC106154878 isoform X2 [Lingula anatina]|eukprot:XP_013384868.1 uncharacterized protein LOC106154878 isoform X1 [Lingula anatina]
MSGNLKIWKCSVLSLLLFDATLAIPVLPFCTRYNENTICSVNSYFKGDTPLCDNNGKKYDNMCQYIKAVCAGAATGKINYECSTPAGDKINHPFSYFSFSVFRPLFDSRSSSSVALHSSPSSLSSSPSPIPPSSIFLFQHKAQKQNQNTIKYPSIPCVNKTISRLPSTVPELKPFFAKYLNVFGVYIVATAGFPDVKMIHAAGVMAQYLDNNGDGLVDSPAVIKNMVKRRATLIMFRDQAEMNAKIEQVEKATEGKYMFQDLEANEIHPPEEHSSEFDESLEEILHLIQDIGITYAFPEQFAQNDTSLLGKAMLKAIKDCGFAFNHTFRYPNCTGLYHFGDPTCDFECLLTEFFYWGLTSILGAQRKRCKTISDEWELCTKKLVRTKLPELYFLLTNPRYKLPSVLPNGDYVHFC